MRSKPEVLTGLSSKQDQQEFDVLSVEARKSGITAQTGPIHWVTAVVSGSVTMVPCVTLTNMIRRDAGALKRHHLVDELPRSGPQDRSDRRVV